MHDVEEILNRELHEVADGLTVPPLPPLSQETRHRHWLPALSAAAVLVVVLSLVAIVASDRDGAEPEPAPPTPTPSETRTTAPPVEVSKEAPSSPYVLDRRLYVGGERVPGEWWSVDFGDDVWIGWRRDYTWWWGRGTEARQIAVGSEIPPAISPNGTYIAYIADEDGMVLTGFDTAPGGEGLDGVPVESPPRFSSQPAPRAVTDDGRIVVQGGGVSMLWLSLDGGETYDLAETAPGQLVIDSTSAGLVVTNADESELYLAEVSDVGEITRTLDLPPAQGLVVSPGAESMAWTPAGTLGGEVTGVGSLEAGSAADGQLMTFIPPDGWTFQVQTWFWEDDDNLISVVAKNGTDRMARCRVLVERCVLIDLP